MSFEKLTHFIPTSSTNELQKLINNYHFNLKIVNGRKTKRGDFRATKPTPTITINNNLSKEQFLITLVHEIAHLDVFLKTPHASAHGIEWKNTFQKLMLPFLHPSIFPDDILSPLANYLINPKATTDYHQTLSTALNQEKAVLSNKKFIHQLEPNSHFIFNAQQFQILNKRRTRYTCINLKNKQQYLISANALVETI